MTKKVRAELERPLGDGLARGGPRGGAICSVLGCLPFMSPFSILPPPPLPFSSQWPGTENQPEQPWKSSAGEIKSKSKKKNCGSVYVFLIKTPPVSLLFLSS